MLGTYNNFFITNWTRMYIKSSWFAKMIKIVFFWPKCVFSKIKISAESHFTTHKRKGTNIISNLPKKSTSFCIQSLIISSQNYLNCQNINEQLLPNNGFIYPKILRSLTGYIVSTGSLQRLLKKKLFNSSIFSGLKPDLVL